MRRNLIIICLFIFLITIIPFICRFAYDGYEILFDFSYLPITFPWEAKDMLIYSIEALTLLGTIFLGLMVRDYEVSNNNFITIRDCFSSIYLDEIRIIYNEDFYNNYFGVELEFISKNKFIPTHYKIIGSYFLSEPEKSLFGIEDIVGNFTSYLSLQKDVVGASYTSSYVITKKPPNKRNLSDIHYITLKIKYINAFEVETSEEIFAELKYKKRDKTYPEDHKVFVFKISDMHIRKQEIKKSDISRYKLDNKKIK